MQEKKKSDSQGQEPDLNGLNAERLALAYRNLQHGEWDDYIGPKPEGFDTMPLIGKKPLVGKTKPGRLNYTLPAAKAILEIVGAANISRLLWRMAQNGTDEEWLHAYVEQAILTDQIRRYGSSL